MAEFLQQDELSTSSSILLFKESPAENITLLKRIASLEVPKSHCAKKKDDSESSANPVEEGKTEKDDKEKQKDENRPRIFLRSDSAMEELCSALVKQMKEENKENAVINQYDVQIFDLADLQLAELMQEAPLYQIYEGSGLTPDQWDVHVALMGIDGLGLKSLKTILESAAFSAHNRITVSVMTDNIREAKAELKRIFADSVLTESDGIFEFNSDVVDGPIRIEVKPLPSSSASLTGWLETTQQTEPLTYVILDLANTSRALDILVTLSRFFKTKSEKSDDTHLHPTIAINTTLDDNLRQIALTCEGLFPDLKYIESPDKFLNIEKIMNVDLEKDAREYHAKYQDLAFVGEGTDSKTWQQLDCFTQQSNRESARFEPVKDAVLNSWLDATGEHKKDFLEKRFGQKGTLISEEEDGWKKQDDFMDRLMEDPVTLDLFKMEHRRWNLFHLVNGWEWNKEKNPALKRHKNLVNSEILMRDYDWVVHYDLMYLLSAYETMKNPQETEASNPG